MEDSILYTLKNGIRLVYSNSSGEISHCGLMIGAGSRNEEKGKEGLAHFIEHVLFKGTTNRRAWQVLNRLEVVGGELNAYTTKEETCIHASMLHDHFERGIELISDIITNATFPEKEIEKEKEVILDEIASYFDNPAEQIFDDFESLVFRGQKLGNPVLGTPVSVKSFSRKDILKFIKHNYTNDRIVFSYTGKIPFSKVCYLTEKYFGSYNRKPVPEKEIRTRSSRKGMKVVNPRSSAHAHYITGNMAYSGYSRKRFPMYVLNNILGGPGMNSKLNMNIREKHGFAYHIESGYMPFRDSGIFNIYFAAERKFLEKCIRLVNSELEKVMNNKISTSALTRYKYQLKGQLAIAQENRAGVMLNNAKSVLNYNKPLQSGDLFKNIDSVTPGQILEVANEIFDSEKMSSLLFEPPDK